MFKVCLAARLVPVSKSLLLPPFSSSHHEAVDRMAAYSSPLVYPQVLHISSVKCWTDKEIAPYALFVKKKKVNSV